MKKFFVSTSFIAIFIISIIYQRVTSINVDPNATNFSAIPNNTNTPSLAVSKASKIITRVNTNSSANVKNSPAKTSSASAPVSSSISTPVASQGKYKNGTYTGTMADASYGTVQVAAVIVSGKLSDINFLSYPSDRQHSAQLSSYALPILRQEAIAAQGASVDTISGASYTSAAFKESLRSALNQAM
jgi:uncharacterized protein with FMN-binding domain